MVGTIAAVTFQPILCTLSVAIGESAVALDGMPPRPRVIVRPLDAVQWSLHYPPILSVQDQAASAARPGVREALSQAAVGDSRALTPELNLQAELRRRDTDSGDLPMRFDRDDFLRDKKGSGLPLHNDQLA